MWNFVTAGTHNKTEEIRRKYSRSLVLGLALLLAPCSWSQTTAIDHELNSLREVRALLTEDLGQYERTLGLLLPEGTLSADSDNPAVKNLSAETKRIRERLISITERELALIEKQTIAIIGGPDAGAADKSPTNSSSTRQSSVESKDISRLLALLNQYHHDRLESLKRQPTAEELARREAARQDAASLA